MPLHYPQDSGTSSGRPLVCRQHSRRHWAIPAEQKTNWAMSSASSSSDHDDATGDSNRISTRSSTRRTLQSSSPLTGVEPDDDTTSGGADSDASGTSSKHTQDRPPCPDDTCPGSLGPICSVPCAVKDLTASPQAEEQHLHHHRMQRDVAQHLAASR